MEMRVDSFIGSDNPYRFFDNVRRLRQGIPIRGLGQGRSIEQAYYMLRTMDDIAALAIMRTTTGISGKGAAEAYTGEMVNDWITKVEIMLECIHAAAARNPEVAAALDNTGDIELVEGNDWGDAIWGRPFITGEDGSRQLGEGYNLTGRAWMMVRQIRRSPGYVAPVSSDVMLDRADHTRFVNEARQILLEAGLTD